MAVFQSHEVIGIRSRLGRKLQRERGRSRVSRLRESESEEAQPLIGGIAQLEVVIAPPLVAAVHHTRAKIDRLANRAARREIDVIPADVVAR